MTASNVSFGNSRLHTFICWNVSALFSLYLDSMWSIATREMSMFTIDWYPSFHISSDSRETPQPAIRMPSSFLMYFWMRAANSGWMSYRWYQSNGSESFVYRSSQYAVLPYWAMERAGPKIRNSKEPF